MKRWILPVLILAPLTFGQVTECPELNFLPLTGWDVVFDPNMIALDHTTDPNDPNDTAQPYLLRPPITVALGQVVRVPGEYVCDPDGDAMVGSASVGTFTLGEGTWAWTYQPTQIGITYAHLTVVDVRPQTHDEKDRTGTIVVQTVPANQRPVFGCGARP